MSSFQQTFHALMDKSASAVLARFDFHAAVKQMIALRYGWVGDRLTEAETEHVALHARLHPNRFTPSFVVTGSLFDSLIYRASRYAKDLVDDATQTAKEECMHPAWPGKSVMRYGFHVVVQSNGVVFLFFAPVYAHNSPGSACEDVFLAFNAQRNLAIVNNNRSPRQPARSFDPTPGTRKLILSQE